MSSRVARLGDNVVCSYRGFLPDGAEFCCGEELLLCIGERKLFPTIEDSLIGMSEGASKDVQLEPTEAYGDYDINRVFTVPFSEIPDDICVERGVSLKLENGEGRQFDAVVTSVNGKSAAVDANHPLAGKNLSYEITLIRFG